MPASDVVGLCWVAESGRHRDRGRRFSTIFWCTTERQAAPGKFEVPRLGALRHRNDGMAVWQFPMVPIPPQTSRVLLAEPLRVSPPEAVAYLLELLIHMAGDLASFL